MSGVLTEAFTGGADEATSLFVFSRELQNRREAVFPHVIQLIHPAISILILEWGNNQAKNLL